MYNLVQGSSSLPRYFSDIARFPILEYKEEYDLAKRWKEKREPIIAEKLVLSHLRLAASIAKKYMNWGLPLQDLISEANLGLIQAVNRYEPDKGARLGTYAVQWIKAAIRDYILRSWSLIKLGQSAVPKKLFFNLSKERERFARNSSGPLKEQEIKMIAKRMGVKEEDVKMMEERLSHRDYSLQQPMGETQRPWQDYLSSDEVPQEEALIQKQEYEQRKKSLEGALRVLSPRERDILKARRLIEPSKKLKELSLRHHVSKERIRQIEMRALEKLVSAIREQKHCLPVSSY